MELNDKILKYGLILICLTLIFTVGFTLVNRLEEPVFLNMYIEEYVYKNPDLYRLENFQLKYITNVEDDRRVIDVYFKEAPDLSVDVSHRPFGGFGFSFFNENTDHKIGDRYWIYSLNTIYLNILIDSEGFDEIEINNAVLSFDDGSTLDVDLGRIVFYEDNNPQDDIDQISSRGSNDGTSSSYYTVKRDIKLMRVDSPIFEEIKDKIEITVGDYDYNQIQGVQYKRDSKLNISSRLKIPSNIIEKYTYYDIKPKLYYEDEEGNTSYFRIYNIHHFPYKIDGRGVFNYLKSRGEI